MSQSSIIPQKNKAAIALLAISVLLAASCREKTREFTGYADADYVYISSPTNSKIDKIFVRKGDTVGKGDKLFQVVDIKQKGDYSSITSADSGLGNYLDDMQKGVRPEEYKVWENIYNATQIMEKIGKVEHNMTESLRQKDAVTANYYWIAAHFHVFSYYLSLAAKEQLEALKLGSRADQILSVRNIRSSVQSQLPYFKYNLDECLQASPYDAIVFDVLYREGELPGAGKPVVILLPPRNIKAVFFADGTEINNMKIHDRVNVYVSGREQPYQAEISYISSKSDFTSPYIYSLKNNEKLVYMLEAVFDSTAVPELPHPGQPITVRIQEKKK